MWIIIFGREGEAGFQYETNFSRTSYLDALTKLTDEDGVSVRWNGLLVEGELFD